MQNVLAKYLILLPKRLNKKVVKLRSPVNLSPVSINNLS